MKKETICPCQSGNTYRSCCKPYHKAWKSPKTAETLMRARYCAYTKYLRGFLMDTWHPTTRPPNLEIDPELKWTGLEILSTNMGSEKDFTGTVTFTAHYTHAGETGSMTEESSFLREGSHWFYLDGK